MYLTQSLHRALQQTPDLPATVCGERTYSVRESVERISRLAGALLDLGVAPGDRVAMLAHNSDRFHEYLLSTWWLGAAVNPVNTRWAPPEVEYALVQSGSRVLLVDDGFVPLAQEVATRLDLVVVYCGDGPAPAGVLSYEVLIAAADPIPDRRFGGDALAAILYTGGTSGFPKGVMLTHQNILVSSLGSQATTPIAAAGGTTLCVAPLFHSAGLVSWNIQAIVGGTHVFVPSFEPVTALAAIQEHSVTSTMLPPVMIQMLIDHPDRDRYDLSSLGTLLYGASPISEALLERAMKALPATSFVQAYGMTEVAPVATLLTGDEHRSGQRRQSAGRPAVHSELKIVGADGATLPAGAVGEVAVRGGHVMRGYWDKPVESAEVLVDGWMHTGDGGFLDDQGYLHIVDRIKDMVLTGGENVFSVEVENVLAKHPAVAACAVIGIPDETYGESVHAVVVLRSGAQVTAEALRRHCKQFISGYKAPRTVEFVDELPVTPTGKVSKRDLRDRHWSGQARSIN